MGEENRIYIPELADIINREMGTIRGWERDGRLPKKLLPKRNDRGWRYWTPAQVKGIEKWMKTHNMRPGNALSNPENESQHIENLRHPKFMTQRTVRKANTMAKHGKTQLEIVDALFDITDYTSKESFLNALAKAFKKRGWTMPPYDEAAKKKREEANASRSRKMKARHIVAKELGVKRLPAKKQSQRKAA